MPEYSYAYIVRPDRVLVSPKILLIPVDRRFKLFRVDIWKSLVVGEGAFSTQLPFVNQSRVAICNRGMAHTNDRHQPWNPFIRPIRLFDGLKPTKKKHFTSLLDH
jgi:hypothetical protein